VQATHHHHQSFEVLCGIDYSVVHTSLQYQYTAMLHSSIGIGIDRWILGALFGIELLTLLIIQHYLETGKTLVHADDGYSIPLSVRSMVSIYSPDSNNVYGSRGGKSESIGSV